MRMRRYTTCLLCLFLAVGLLSCRKDRYQPTFKQYDDDQIKAYIAANHLTGMIRDTTGGDTTGIYYQVLTQGTGPAVDYSSALTYTYSVQSLDGKYALNDTILNHQNQYLGHITPAGLLIAMHDAVKRQGTRVRILVPSHLAYGQNGATIGTAYTLSNAQTGTVKMGGNESLDYYVNIINNVTSQNGIAYPNNFNTYDDQSIANYIAANNLTGFTKITTGTYAGLYYKTRTAGTGTTQVVPTSTVNIYYRGKLLDNNVFDPSNYSTTNISTLTTGVVSDYTLGFMKGLLMAGVSGTDFSIIVPSRLAYGINANTGIPALSCLYFDVTINTVTN